MKTTYISIPLMLFLFLACKMGNKKTDFTEKGSLHQPELTFIQGLPEGFVGCSCVLSRTEADYKAQKFVYLEKYGLADESLNYTMISLNGEVVKWFANENPKGFTVEIRYDASESKNPENTKKTGRMTLRFTDGTVLETPVSGFCGC